MCFRAYYFSAKRRGLDFLLTESDFVALSSVNCHYCGSPPSNIYELKYKDGTPRSGKPYIYNGIDRVDAFKGYSIDNCVTCCFICNRAKSDMTTQEFESWINKIIEYRKVG
jgi:5-methylcytosine-specific restriction endonuclease McrA